MKTKPFRLMPKEHMQIKIPPALSTAVRQKAAKQRRSISEVSCEAMARGLDLDPAAFGIAVESPLTT